MDCEVSFPSTFSTIVNWTKSENLVTECQYGGTNESLCKCRFFEFSFCEVARGKVLNLSHSSAFLCVVKASVLFKVSYAIICLA